MSKQFIFLCCLAIMLATPVFAVSIVEVSVSPDIVEPLETLYIAADVWVEAETQAVPANISSITATIVRIFNGTQTTIINQTTMTFLQDGIWQYEFDVLNNMTGTYVAIVDVITSTIPANTVYDSKTFFVESRGDVHVEGVSPDLMNINNLYQLSADVLKNSFPIDVGSIEDPQLTITQVGGPTEVFNLTTGLNRSAGQIYKNHIFNETGTYFLNWSLTYQNKERFTAEVVEVVDWDEKFANLSSTGNLSELILANRDFIIQALEDAQEEREFAEEQIFLVTDSVSTMESMVIELEKGAASEKETYYEFLEVSEFTERLLSRKEKRTNYMGWIIGGILLILVIAYLTRPVKRKPQSRPMLRHLKETYEKQYSNEPSKIKLSDINVQFIADLFRRKRE